MKPTTVLQKRVVELSTQLPIITDKQSQWAYKKCFDSYATQLRKNLYCLECGHTWNDETPEWHNEIAGCKCPKCETELKMFKHNGNCRKTEYFSILTTKGSFQVQRVIMVHKDMKKRTQANNHFVEVMQHWVGSDGRKTTLSLSTNGMSMYYDNWKYGSGLEIRSQSNNSHLRDNLNVPAVYPERKVLSVIKRNGFKGNFYDIPNHKLFSMLIKDPFAETLLKTNQISLLRYYSEIKGSAPISATWMPPIKICIRNNYIIKDISTWMDYVQLLIYFKKDLRNAKYVCPSDLKLVHDRLVAKKRAIQRKEKLEQMRLEIQEAQVQYIAQKKMFFGLQFVSKNITVKVIESVQEFMEEGDELNHCLFTNEYHKKHDSLVLSARIESKPIETIEVSLTDLKILQARGQGNKATKYHKQIVDLVNNNLEEIRKIVIKTRVRSSKKAAA
jgi:hypothetical protein